MSEPMQPGPIEALKRIARGPYLLLRRFVSKFRMPIGIA